MIKRDLRCDSTLTQRGQHEPVSERNNRTMSAAIRCRHNSLPYKAVPRLMTEYLVEDTIEKFNQFPAKGGVSDYYSPDLLTGGQPLNYERDFAASLGSYVLIGNEAHPYNTNAPRMIDCIYLKPDKSPQGGHILMNLDSGKKTTRG